jgi:hypothetical protein
MVDNAKEVRKQILNCIGCIAAVVTILAYLLLCINSAWPFLDQTTFVYKVMLAIKTWAPLVVVGIVGWEFVADKHIAVRILFYAAIALLVIFMFFPSTWTQVVGFVK